MNKRIETSIEKLRELAVDLRMQANEIDAAIKAFESCKNEDFTCSSMMVAISSAPRVLNNTIRLGEPRFEVKEIEIWSNLVEYFATELKKRETES